MTDEDKDTDREAVEKLTSMIEERLKTRPLPPPPPITDGGSGNSNSDVPAKSRDGDSEMRNGEFSLWKWVVLSFVVVIRRDCF